MQRKYYKRGKSGPEKLGDFLMPALAQKGLKKTVTSAQICFYASTYNPDLFAPISFSRGILKVSVASSGAAQLVQLEEEKIIAKINQELGQELVKSVRLVNTG